MHVAYFAIIKFIVFYLQHPGNNLTWQHWQGHS